MIDVKLLNANVGALLHFSNAQLHLPLIIYIPINYYVHSFNKLLTWSQ